MCLSTLFCLFPLIAGARFRFSVRLSPVARYLGTKNPTLLGVGRGVARVQVFSFNPNKYRMKNLYCLGFVCLVFFELNLACIASAACASVRSVTRQHT